MKSIINSGLVLFGIILISSSASSQVKTNSSSQSENQIKMETNPNNSSVETFFIDKFFIPISSIDEFNQRMSYNRNFIKNLTGFIRDDVYEHKDQDGNLNVITIAVWKNQECINNAKEAVLAEYKRIGFNPLEFYQRLNIKMERNLYTKKQD